MSFRMQHHIRFFPVALVIATLLGQFAGMALYAAPANAAPTTGTQQRQQVALSGGDLVDVAAANSSLVLGARAADSQNVQDPASSLLTIDTVGDSVQIGLDATSIAGNLPAGAQSGDVTLTLVKAVTPDTGGVQARDDKGTVVLGSAPEDSKSVTIPSNGRRVDSWVFNAQGRFILTFQASVAVTAGGKATTWKSQETTYAVQVGGPVKPVVTLSAAKTQVDSGADVPLTAALDSQQAAGTVSFKDGDKNLGTVAVKDGTAAYTAKSLSDGKHSIVATFTPADSTEYAASSSQQVTVKIGKSAAPKVFEGGSLELVPKLSTNQDTSDCAQTKQCVPNSMQAGLVDRTQVDRSNAALLADRPWDTMKWYAPDDAVIHVGLRSDGYTIPTTQIVGQDAPFYGINFGNNIPARGVIQDTSQTIPEYLANATPNNLFLSTANELDKSGIGAGINSEMFSGGISTVNLQLGKLNAAPAGGTVSATIMSFGNLITQTSDDQQGSSTPWLLSGSKGRNNVDLPQWSFSQPGTYCVPITTTENLRLSGGGTGTISATGVYTFVVGNTVDPKTVTPCSQDAGSSSSPSNQPATLITGSGHHDIRVYRAQGENKFTFGLDAASGPLSNLIWANTAGPTTVGDPANSSDDMTNVGPVGTKYWYYPYTDQQNTPWPGFSAESLKVSDFQSPLTWRFTGFSRDGVANPADTTVSMQQPGGGLIESDWNSRRGFPTAFQGQPLTHFHPVWAFTKPGIYCIATEATAKTSDAGWISGSGQITMVVGTHADDPKIPADLQKAVDDGTLTPCERNGKPAPVAATKSMLPETTTNDVVSSLTGGQYKQALVNVGWDAKGSLDQRADVATSVGDMLANRVTTDSNNVIYAAPGFDQRDAAWSNIGLFALDTTTMQPSSLKDGTVKFTLDDRVKGPKDGVVKVISRSNWPEPLQLSSAPGGRRSFDVVAQDSTMSPGLWWYFTKPGVYCVPVTVSATKPDGSAQESSKTYTFIAGNTTDPKAADYVDASKVTTCSRGQAGQEAVQPGGNGTGTGTGNGGSVSHDEIYVPNESSTDSGALILNQGHVDIASRLNGSTLQSWVKDSTNGDGIIRWHALTGSNASSDPLRGQPAVSANGETNEFTSARGVVFQTFPDAKTTVPAGSQWGFLGKTGSDIWQLPQVQDPSLLWAGWSTQAMSPDATQTGVQWTLDRIAMLDGTAPKGNFSIYETNTFGTPSVLFQAEGGKVRQGSFEIAKNAHVHANWSFGAQGTYCLAFTRSTTLADGTKASDSFTLPVAVGEVNVRKVDPAACFQNTQPAVDRAALDAAVSAAGKFKEADYTPVSWAVFAKALAGAKSVQADAKADQTAVDAAVAALAKAQAALVKAAPAPTPVKVDKSKLDAAVAAAGRLRQSDYTADSWAAFAKALAGAKGVQADDSATQADVDSVTGALTKAQTVLVKAAPAPVKADKAALDKAIAAASGLKEADYTADSWAVFAKALAGAKAAQADAKAVQADVDAAVAAVAKAQTALVKAAPAPSPTPKPTKPSTPSTNGNAPGSNGAKDTSPKGAVSSSKGSQNAGKNANNASGVRLSATGSNVAVFGVVAAVLVLAGVALAVIARSRRK